MIFKKFRDNITEHLNKLINGKPLVFTHRNFYGYKFQVIAIKEDAK